MQLSDRIGRRMKLQDLHVLMTVVQAGSMGKAAQLLNTSQPAISRSIAELESAFGIRLLDRSRRGIEPTEYGRALLDCGVAVFDELRRGVKNIEFLDDPTAGPNWNDFSSGRDLRRTRYRPTISALSTRCVSSYYRRFAGAAPRAERT